MAISNKTLPSSVIASPVARDENVDGFEDDRAGAGSSPIDGQPRKSNVTISGDEVQSVSITDVTDYNPIVPGSGEYNTPRLSRGIIDGTISDTHKKSLTKVTTASGSTVTEPASPYAAKYPFNRVDESDSGHYKEIDDTPGSERIKEVHRTGTFYEIHPDGSKVTKVVADNFAVVIGKNTVSVQGDCNLTVHGNVNLYCKKNMVQKVDGDFALNIGGDFTSDVGGDVTEKVEGDMFRTYKSDLIETVTGDVTETYVTGQMTTSIGKIIITAAKIKLKD